MRALQLAVAAAATIQTANPSIAEDYRKGSSLNTLTRDYEIGERYKLPHQIARNAVYIALVGYSGGGDLPEITGLLNPEEVKPIGQDHRKKNASNLGVKLKDSGRGIFGMSPEKRSSVGRKSGSKLYEEKKGIFSLDIEAKKRNCRTAMIARGAVPMIARQELETHTVFGELEYLIRLAETPSLQHTRAQYRGRPNWGEIARIINELYHEGRKVRSKSTVTSIYHANKSKDLKAKL